MPNIKLCSTIINLHLLILHSDENIEFSITTNLRDYVVSTKLITDVMGKTIRTTEQ